MATPKAEVYTWQGYRCSYEVYPGSPELPPLLLIHPLGVGLAGWFWHRFCQQWQQQGQQNSIYNPDLLGCGHSDQPAVAYTPQDWANQLAYFTRQVIQKPVVVVAQGATLPIALKLLHHPQMEGLVRSLVLSGPPGWKLITTPSPTWRQHLLWNLLFSGPVGWGLFRYVRRQRFLRSFSRRQLFGREADIDQEWLDHLAQDAKQARGRYAVYSFLAGFWREDYTEAISNLQVPTLVLFGDAASGISRLSQTEQAGQRLQAYLDHLPQARGDIIPGRNLLPYESTASFISHLADWLACPG
ncbi:MAG: alpha/beta hydrolase [Cyanobacteria bacterium REEB459]|nr:alpha/beta hydrolase [Cyanobacteria bacterium REEB459]